MKHFFIFFLTAALILSFGCGKSGPSDNKGDKAGKGTSTAASKTEQDGKESQKGKGKDKELTMEDIDKMDIPEQFKAAIKSGKIPLSRVKEMLAARGGGGGDAPLVNVEKVIRRSLNSYLVMNGIVEPERKVEVFARLSAFVKQIVKEEGAFVQENEVLALLDDTEIRITYQQAKIALEQSKLSLEEEENNFKRNQELSKDNLISEKDFQASEALFKQRKLDYDNRLESYKNLEIQLDYSKIRSLSEGYVTERLIEVGDRVNPNQQVYSVEDFSPLLIKVYVPSSDVIQLKTGMLSEVSTDILKGKVFNGSVKLINPRIDVQSGTVKVTVEVYDESLMLKPGTFVEVRIIIGQKENIIVIPRKAVTYKRNKTYVFAMSRGQVSQKEVQLGLMEEDLVEVLSGLDEGEAIVVVGVESLKDGQRVQVVR